MSDLHRPTSPLLRPLAPSDFQPICAVADEWWGGRPVRQVLHRLFFDHFSSTSFALCEGDDIVAFLIGFRSQAHPHVAYIHMVGVAPSHRSRGHGRLLYSRFFDSVAALGCSEVHSMTSPVNKASIAFHQQMGFSIVDSATQEDGVAVSLDHAGPGQHRVLFRKQLLGQALS